MKTLLAIALLSLESVCRAGIMTNVIPNGFTFINVTNGIFETNSPGGVIDGHRVTTWFEWEVVTNRFTHSSENLFDGYSPCDQWYAVDSNYVCVLVIDGKTNEVIQEGVGSQLGEMHYTIQRYQAMRTNSAVFEPQEKSK